MAFSNTFNAIFLYSFSCISLLPFVLFCFIVLAHYYSFVELHSLDKSKLLKDGLYTEECCGESSDFLGRTMADLSKWWPWYPEVEHLLRYAKPGV